METDALMVKRDWRWCDGQSASFCRLTGSCFPLILIHVKVLSLPTQNAVITSSPGCIIEKKGLTEDIQRLAEETCVNVM